MQPSSTVTLEAFRAAPGSALDTLELFSAWSLPKEMQTDRTGLNILTDLIDT
jgi:hypothetical protein